ncbi:MAG: hypothetical protein AAFO94_19285, partial [Bacteroidota bacterium]
EFDLIAQNGSDGSTQILRYTSGDDLLLNAANSLIFRRGGATYAQIGADGFLNLTALTANASSPSIFSVPYFENGDGRIRRASFADFKASLGYSIPSNQIVFGSGTGIQSNDRFTYDPVLHSVLISSTSANNTNKFGRLMVPHYDSTEEPILGVGALSQSTSSTLDFGGGSTVANAATLIRFYTAPDNTTLVGTEAMRIDNIGNIGVGRNPSFKMDVAGTVRSYKYNLVNSAQNDWMVQLSHGSAISGFWNSANNADLYLRQSSGVIGALIRSSGSTYFNGGPVGFGLSSPVSNTAVTIRGGLLIENSSGGADSWLPFSDGSFYYTADQGAGGGHHIFRTYNGTYLERVRFTADGDAGFGTSTPSQKVHVNGNIRVTGSYFDSNNSQGTNGQQLTSNGAGSLTYQFTQWNTIVGIPASISDRAKLDSCWLSPS